jgi:hypothetical protein
MSWVRFLGNIRKVAMTMKKENTFPLVKKSSRLTRPRYDWEARFKEMASKKDDILLDKSVSTTWDENEWEWELSAEVKSTPPHRSRC